MPPPAAQARLPALFIADLHIDPQRPDILATFARFCTGPARRAREVYILGDLFEAWIGDDDDDPVAERTAATIADLAAAGVAVHFLPGNRDFLLGPDFARRAGLSLLAGPVVLDLAGSRTLVLHGDELCTDDSDHQAFRARVSDPQWRRDFLARPLAERRQLAADMRAMSRRSIEAKPTATLDVNADAVCRAFREWGVERMIHGHTHRPARHRLEVDGHTVERWVLGDWFEQGGGIAVDTAGWHSLSID